MIRTLNAEWSHLSDSPATMAAIAEWQQACPLLAHVSTGDELLAAIPSAPDEILGFLIARHHEGSELAGRIVLQAMLGKIVLMSAHRDAAVASEMVSQMWVCIAQYPLDRRPRSVAANLALDTRKRAWASLDLDRAQCETSIDPAEVVELAAARTRAEWTADADRAAELLDRALAAGIIGPAAHALMVTIYREGRTPEEAAQLHGITYGSVRTSTWASRRRMKEALPLLIAA